MARQLLDDKEPFRPCCDFREHALVRDESLHAEAAADPEAWWRKLAGQLEWMVEPSEVLDDSNPPFYRWFADGRINASANCLDRHVQAGNGGRVAFHWHGEEGEQRAVTYADLHRDVQRLANVLLERGVEAGDVVGIYLPMIPEVAVAMLACARIGAPHNVVFGGFSPEAVKERMQFSDARALITVDAARRKGKVAEIKPAVDGFLDQTPTIETVIVVRNTGTEVAMREGRDLFYDEAIAAADPECPPAELEAEHPLYILYSSGSTAKPKGILHTTGGYLTGVAWTLRHVFDLRPETDVFWCSADVGWVTGHSYIVYGPLLEGAHRLQASPLARRLAQENQTDLVSLCGSGSGGRIVKADVESAALASRSTPTNQLLRSTPLSEQQPSASSPAQAGIAPPIPREPPSAPASPSALAGSFSASTDGASTAKGTVTVIEPSKFQQTVARRMAEASSAP